jgi:hypothetical protein
MVAIVATPLTTSGAVRMKKPVWRILFAAVGVGLAAVLTVSIVKDRQRVRAAEKVKTMEDFAEFIAHHPGSHYLDTQPAESRLSSGPLSFCPSSQGRSDSTTTCPGRDTP